MWLDCPRRLRPTTPSATPSGRVRQLHIIDRMEENHFITPEEAVTARKEELKIRTGADKAPASTQNMWPKWRVS